ESLELCAARTLPYLDGTLVPAIEAGRNLFVAAHGNSLRSVVMAIEGLSEDEVLSLEIPTGVPRVYAREDGAWRRVEL
ncbi:MAG: phosphoglycerate mutase, partial [Euryarchaeota archaeon]|nr:phosphoglycerate mutase [Euryarchaeota archaeon]